MKRLGNYKWQYCNKHGRYVLVHGVYGCPKCKEEK